MGSEICSFDAQNNGVSDVSNEQICFSEKGESFTKKYDGEKKVNVFWRSKFIDPPEKGSKEKADKETSEKDDKSEKAEKPAWGCSKIEGSIGTGGIEIRGTIERVPKDSGK